MTKVKSILETVVAIVLGVVIIEVLFLGLPVIVMWVFGQDIDFLLKFLFS